VADLIQARASDDPAVIEFFNSIVAGLLSERAPEEFYLVQIDNWFDQKWLGFSGYGTAKPPFGYPLLGRFEAVKVEVSSDKLTLPPFNPNRIASQRCFARSGAWYEDAPLGPPHRFTKQRSKQNIQHRVENAFSSACLVWYSSNTIANDRASLMAYTVKDGAVDSWYSSFQRTDRWRIHSVKGTSRESIEALIAKGADSRTEARGSAPFGLSDSSTD
jgi:hypothetical protein